MARFILARKGNERIHCFFIGIDVHKCSYHVATISPDGEVKDWVCSPDAESLIKRLVNIGISGGTVAYEAGPTGFRLARSLEAAGYSVIVAAPSRVARPSTKGAKTDRLDCLKLADYAAKGIL